MIKKILSCVVAIIVSVQFLNIQVYATIQNEENNAGLIREIDVTYEDFTFHYIIHCDSPLFIFDQISVKYSNVKDSQQTKTVEVEVLDERTLIFDLVDFEQTGSVEDYDVFLVYNNKEVPVYEEKLDSYKVNFEVKGNIVESPKDEKTLQIVEESNDEKKYVEESHVYNYSNNKTPLISNIKSSKISDGVFKISVDLVNINEVERVIFPTWTLKNGQDDLVWGQGEIQNNQTSYIVSAADHKFEDGEYVTQVIAYRSDGSSELLQVFFTMKSEGPSISNAKIIDIQNGFYSVEADVSSDFGIEKILLATWSLANNQDDLTIQEVKRNVDNKIRYTVDMKDHNYEEGSYVTQIIAYDNIGQFAIGQIIEEIKNNGPVINNLSISTPIEGAFKITANIDGGYGLDKVVCPVWTSKNNQDDLEWITADIDGNHVSCTVNLKQHNYEEGTYVNQMIVYDKAGKSVIGQTIEDIKLDSINITDMTVVETSNGKYSVQAKVSSSYGIERIVVPTWTDNQGQDDLTWGIAELSGDTFTYTVDMKDHNYELGTYITQFIAYDYAGYTVTETVFQEMENHPPVISDMKIIACTDGRYTVQAKITSEYDILKVIVPTWTNNKGQDDLTLDVAEVNGNLVTYTVDMKDHNYEVGTYITQFIAYDKAGLSTTGTVLQEVKNHPPVISDMKIIAFTDGRYTVQAKITSEYDISKVIVPTWTSNKGQDDLTLDVAEVNGDLVTYTVDMKDHNYEEGTYVTQFIAYDSSGLSTIGTILHEVENQPPVISDIKISDVNSWGYTITCTVVDNYDVGDVYFPSWTVANGQDDITWGKGVVSGNIITYRVHASEHRHGLGEYNTHIYAYDAAGKLTVAYAPAITIYTNSSAPGWSIINGTKYLFNKEGKEVEGARKLIIDISEHNGDIDWEMVRNSGVDGVILRCGYGWADDIETQRDKQFIKNAKELERLGIPYGVYLFSYESSEYGAVKEAEYTLRLIKDRKISLPVYYDLEYSNYAGDISRETYVKMAKAYCEKIISGGYETGIYANLNYWNNKLNDSSLDVYNKWVAQYNMNDGNAGHCDYNKVYQMWQYTSVGNVSGIRGNVDMNAWFE